ncbi:MAG: SWIM zinc finger family protein, partial [Verrucomicrobiota bacterium]
MTKFTGALAQLFNRKTRERGEDYFRSGRVKVEWSDEYFFEATVHGSRPYDVTLELGDNGMVARCDCPHFNEGFFCKHIWAVLMAADKEAQFDPPSGPPVSAVRDDVDEEVWDEDSAIDIPDYSSPQKQAIQFPGAATGPERGKSWQAVLGSVPGYQPVEHSGAAGRESEVRYAIDIQDVFKRGMVLYIEQRARKKNGDWGKVKPLRCSPEDIARLPERTDREILSLLSEWTNPWHQNSYYRPKTESNFPMPEGLQPVLIPMLCESGRFFLYDYEDRQLGPLTWDGDSRWSFGMTMTENKQQESFLITGRLIDEDREVPLAEPAFLLRNGWIYWNDRISRLKNPEDFEWLRALRKHGDIRIPAEEIDSFMTQMLDKGCPASLTLPDELAYSRETLTPRPVFKVKQFAQQHIDHLLTARLDFDYDGHLIPFDETVAGVFQKEKKRFIHRDRAAEQK